MKKSALDFMKTYKRRIFAIILFDICIAYVIVSSINIYDYYYTHYNIDEISSEIVRHSILNDGVTIFPPQFPITFNEGVAIVFRTWLKGIGAVMYGNVLYLWAWNDFLNKEQKSEIVVCALFGTFVFYLSYLT